MSTSRRSGSWVSALLFALGALSWSGCGDDDGAGSDGGSVDGAATDGGAGADASPAAACADVFGTALPAGFVRVDGTVLAVVPPGHPTCARPNGTHLVVQVSMNGAAYRMVVNVMSTRAGVDPRVRFAALTGAGAALPGPAWAEGVHEGVTLDYAALGLVANTAPFTPVEMAPLVDQLLARVPVGARISVFADGNAGESKHLVHRNGGGKDGALVIDPTGSPTLLVFHFENQTF